MKLLVSPSPHVHSGDSIEKNMYGVLIALIPAFICSVLFFGMGAIIVTLTSVLACLFFEYMIQKFILKQQPTIFDGSALITGVLLAFNVPSNLPVDHHYRCPGGYRHRKNELRRPGLQYFQPGINRPCIPADFFPGTNDHLAFGPGLFRFLH